MRRCFSHVLWFEAYAESYTSVVDLEDDTYVLLQLMFTNAGMGDQKAACRALIVPPGSKEIIQSKIPRDEWKYVPKEKGLYVGECHFQRSEKKRLCCKTDTAHAYLTIDAAPSKQSPGKSLPTRKHPRV